MDIFCLSYYRRKLSPFKKKLLRFINRLRGRILFGTGENSIRDGWEGKDLSIHRYYVEKFMQENSGAIRGHCLEFQEDTYCTRFGKEKINKIDILHKEPGNPLATIVADLCTNNNIASNLFDCIICTYTLHLVFEFNKFISELYRILRVKGNVLLAVPQNMIYYSKYQEYWRFTPEGLHQLLSKYFGSNNILIKSYGNSLTAAGELRGLTRPDIFKWEIDKHDERYAMVICAKAIKV
jgi:SAM-dependent methyltransferase